MTILEAEMQGEIDVHQSCGALGQMRMRKVSRKWSEWELDKKDRQHLGGNGFGDYLLCLRTKTGLKKVW